MELSRLRPFLAVAEAGSFSRAAAALHLTQPSLSRQIQLLEDELGQRLFERTGRGVVPTESGLALMVHARAIFELAEKASADMQERQRHPRGQLTIGLPPRVAQVITADLIERFHAQFPLASLTVVEGLSIRLREWLLGGKLDLAILFDPPATPQIQTETLLREPLVLVSTDVLAPRIRLADVALRRLVMPAAPNALRELLDAHVRPRGLRLRLVAEVDSVQTVLSLVARGLADTVLPISATRAWTYRQRLHVATIFAPRLRNRLVLAVPAARPATALTRASASLLKGLVDEDMSTPT